MLHLYIYINNNIHIVKIHFNKNFLLNTLMFIYNQIEKYMIIKLKVFQNPLAS